MAITFSQISDINIYRYFFKDNLYVNILTVVNTSGSYNTDDIITDSNDLYNLLLAGGLVWYDTVFYAFDRSAGYVTPFSVTKDDLSFSWTCTPNTDLTVYSGNLSIPETNSGLYAQLPDDFGRSTWKIVPMYVRYLNESGAPYADQWLNFESQAAGVGDVGTYPDSLNYGHVGIESISPDNIEAISGFHEPLTSITTMLNGAVEYDPNNPYAGGDVPDDPGDGEFDYTGGGIDIPDLPTISVCDSGFVTLYAPTSTQLNSLASFLWSDAFSLDTFKKLFNNPMDCILGLSIIPVNVPTGTAQEITVGNIVSTVSCNVVTQQFVTVDCGTLKISPTKFSGSYLDYSPYVKCYIYLPFIGIQQINIDDVMNSTVHVVYHVDLLTGAMCCYIEAQNRTTGGVSQDDTVLYTFMGQCAESVPLSSTSFSNTIGSILNAAASIGGVVATAATGGAAAPVAAGMLAGATTATANAATSLKPNIQHSGSMGGSSGMMAIKRPFMIFDAPHTAIPSKQYKYTGYPSNKIVKLSSLSGFNVIQAINLSVDGANQTELNEIKSHLESGVII